MIHRATRSVFRFLLTAAPQRLSILIYHRVLAEPDPLRAGEPDASTLRWQMETVGRVFNVLPLGEAFSRWRNGSLPSRAAAVTFDDGYADNATVALPVLRELGLPATVFVATGFLNGGRMFNDTVIEAVRRLPAQPFDLAQLGIDGLDGTRPLKGDAERAALISQLLPHFKYADATHRQAMMQRLESLVPASLPDDLMMTDDQVRQLAAAGIDIGAHTVTHPILRTLGDAAAAREIGDSKRRLEEVTGSTVTLFAYPNGKPGDDYGTRDVRLVREAGFRAAVSTCPGVAGPDTDPWQLPRFTPWDRTPGRFLLRMGMNVAGMIR